MENSVKVMNSSFAQTASSVDHFGEAVEFYKIVFGISDGLGIIGNFVVILTFLTNGSMRSSVYILLCNLAISDLLFAILAPFHVNMLTEQYFWNFGETFCKVYFVFYRLLYSVSIMILTAITVQRFRATRYPIALRVKLRQTCAVVATCWVLSAIISSPFFFVMKHTSIGKEYICFQEWPNKTSQQAYYIFIYTFLYILPLFFMTIMNGSIFVRLRKPPIGNVTSTQRRQSRKREKMSMVIGIIILMFFICWTPYTVLEFIQAMDLTFGDLTRLAVAKNYSSLAVVFSTAVNPILLNFMSSEFREGLKVLFRRFSRRCSGTVGVNPAEGPDIEIGRCIPANGNRIVIGNTGGGVM